MGALVNPSSQAALLEVLTLVFLQAPGKACLEAMSRGTQG